MLKSTERCDIIERYLSFYGPIVKTSGWVPIEQPRLRLTPTYWHIQYLKEAIESFKNKQFIASIVLSSALVETCLYWEYIRTDPKYQKAGTVLPSKLSLSDLVIIHEKTAVPLKILLDEGESFKKPSETHYIQTRNKFAHANVNHILDNPSILLPNTESEWDKFGIDKEEYLNAYIHGRGLENLAYVHLIKTLEFLKQFENYIKEKHQL